MKIYSSYLDISKFEKDFTTIFSKNCPCEGTDEGNAVMESVIDKINGVHRSIPDFLRSLDDIMDQQIQMCCRSITIAQMYNAKLDYRSGRPYVETSPYSNDILMLRCQGSTAIVSKYGRIIVDEGIISTHSGMFYSGGFVVFNISDRKYGFMSTSGSVILPCIFDDCDMHIGEYNFLYNRVNFRLCLHGKLNSVGNSEIQKFIDYYDESDTAYCINEDSCIYSLCQQNLLSTDSKYVKLPREKKLDATQEVTSRLSNYLVSKEQLQHILESK